MAGRPRDEKPLRAMLRLARTQARASWRHDIPPGLLNGYRIIGEVGRGAQGVVFRAIQRSTKRVVAIKIVRTGADSNDVRAEARRLGVMKAHPNVVQVHDVQAVSDRIAIIMDYVDGPTLNRFIPFGEAPIEKICKLVASICEGVQTAHRHGLIHRDLKPENVRVSAEGVPVVVDFGLAIEDKVAAGGRATFSGFLGTPKWASPEQLAGNASPIDVRSDIYAIGVILYKALTNRFPYEPADDVPGLLSRMAGGRPVNPHVHRRAIPEELSAIVLKCLSHDPNGRYESARDVSSELHAFLDGNAVRADKRLGYRVRKTLKRHRAVALSALFFFGLLVAGFLNERSHARAARTLADLANKERGVAVAAHAEIARNYRDLSTLTDLFESVILGSDPYSCEFDSVRSQLFDYFARSLEGKLDEAMLERPEIGMRVRCVLGTVRRNLNDLPSAEKQLVRAYALAQQVGCMHPDFSDVADALAQLRQAQGRPDEADELYQIAMETASRVDGPDSRTALTHQANLAALRMRVGAYQEAADLLADVLRRTNSDEWDEVESYSTLSSLGACLVKLGNFADAEIPLEQSYQGLMHYCGGLSWLGAKAAINLAICTRARDWEKSKSIIAEAASYLETNLGVDHPDTLEAALVGLNTLLWRPAGSKRSPALSPEEIELGERLALIVLSQPDESGRFDGPRHFDVASAWAELLLKKQQVELARAVMRAAIGNLSQRDDLPPATVVGGWASYASFLQLEVPAANPDADAVDCMREAEAGWIECIRRGGAKADLPARVRGGRYARLGECRMRVYGWPAGTEDVLRGMALLSEALEQSPDRTVSAKIDDLEALLERACAD